MNITICIGSSCHLKGSREVVEQLQSLIDEYNLKDQVELVGSFCMGECVNGVSVKLNDVIYSVQPTTVKSFFEKNVLAKVSAK